MDQEFTASQGRSSYYTQPSDSEAVPQPWPLGYHAGQPFNIPQSGSNSQMIGFQAVQHMRPDVFSSSDSTFDSSHASMNQNGPWSTDDSSQSFTFYNDGRDPSPGKGVDLPSSNAPLDQRTSPSLTRKDYHNTSGPQTFLQTDFHNAGGRFANDQAMEANRSSWFENSSPVQPKRSARESMSERGSGISHASQVADLPTREYQQRPGKRRRPPSCHSSGNWLSHTICSLWRRNHFSSFLSSDLDYIEEAFGIPADEMNATWCALYGDAKISKEPRSPNLKLRYIDVFCSIWRLAFLDSAMPTEGQIDALSQILNADRSEILDWFRTKSATEDGKTSADIEAEAVQKFRGNQQECLDPQVRNLIPPFFKLPKHESSRPLVCTTGCGESFSDSKAWRKHEEKNWRQTLWCCALKDCSKRKANKHVFFRPDTFENHITSAHDDVPGHEVKNIKSRAKRSDFSQYPRECVFLDCRETFTSWKHRLDHLEADFRKKRWSAKDWRNWKNSNDDDDDPMNSDENTDYSSPEEKGGFSDDDHEVSGHEDNDQDSGGGSQSKTKIKKPPGKPSSSRQHVSEGGPLEAVDNTSHAETEGFPDEKSSLRSASSASTARAMPWQTKKADPIPSGYESNCPPFEYESLRSDRHIRLLQLNSEISWSLKSVSLDSDPTYTALSYTWGSNASAHPVSCNGKLLEIPTHCYEALKYLQQAEFFRRDQFVWVDAICIDQGTSQEREQQGMLMEEIYRKAARAIVWLGKDKSDPADPSRNGSISLVTFDDMAGPTPVRSDWSRRTSETNWSIEDSASPPDTATLQPSIGSRTPMSSKQDTMSSSMLSLALTDKVQPFRFQMGYRCFDESAAYVESWLEPQSVVPLGQSGSARVDRVSFNHGSHVFARKVIRLHSACQMFFPQEAISMRRLHHPHIVHLVLGYLKADTLTILMWPAADANLQQYMQSRSVSRPPSENDWRWFGCLISGLVYMHDMGLRHRDIKPSNILLKDGEILYADFGLSNDTKVDSSQDSLVGNFTRQYAAPEFAGGHRGKASDVWSLGCVFLELVTVLLGQSVKAAYSSCFPEGQQKADRAYYKNQKSLEAWILAIDRHVSARISTHNLKPGRELIQVVLRACKEMTRLSPRARPSARELSSRFPTSTCCGMAESLAVTNEAATSFLQQLHWNVLNFLVRPDDSNNMESDLVTIRSIISRLSRCGWQVPAQMDLHQQVRLFTDQIASPFKTANKSGDSPRPTSIDFNVNQTLQDNLACPTDGYPHPIWKDMRKYIADLGKIWAPSKEAETTSIDDTQCKPAVEILDIKKEAMAADGGSFQKSFEPSQVQLQQWQPAILELPVAKCSYSYKHNGQLLLGTAWFLYRELGWSLDEALRITVHYDYAEHDKCNCSVDSIFSRVCSDRYCHSMRKVRKVIDQKKGPKRSSKLARNPAQRQRVSKAAHKEPVCDSPQSELSGKLRRIKDRFAGPKPGDDNASSSSAPRSSTIRDFDFHRLYEFGRKRKSARTGHTVEGEAVPRERKHRLAFWI